MKRASILVLLVLAGPAGAEPRVTKAVCDRLVAHEPGPGVAYQPGVDVRGRPVAPADVGAATVVVPPAVEVEIFARPRGEGSRGEEAVVSRPGRYDGVPHIGTILVGPDGGLLLDGRPLRDPESAYIASLCRRR